MNLIESTHFNLVSGGVSSHCPVIPENEKEKLSLGALVGTGLGLTIAVFNHAPKKSYPFFMLQGHLLGMAAHFLIKFKRFYDERNETNNQCIVPVIDAVCR